MTWSVPVPPPPIGQPEILPEENRGWSLANSDSLVPPRVPDFTFQLPGYRRITETDSTGDTLVVAMQHYDDRVGIPVRIDLDDYYQLRREQHRQELFVQSTQKIREQEQSQSDQKLELVGADIAGQRVSLRVSGNVNINARATREDKNLKTTNIRNEPNTNILFNQRQNFSIQGSIGERINVNVDYNSERDFQFENDVNINYTGDEDDIIQRVDAGNISLSLPGTQLVTFSPNSSGLFGVRSDMKIGPIDLVTVASIEQGKKQKVSYEGGSSEQTYEVYDYQYVKDKYFFLDEYYRRNFYPLRSSDNRHFTVPANRQIDDIEVFMSLVGYREEGSRVRGQAWVNPNDTTEFADRMRETDFQVLEQDVDYEVNRDLGYIRLMKSNLQENQILAVAYTTGDGTVIGDLNYNPEDSAAIDLKILRASNPNPDDPTWDLMFKNVYSLGTSNLTEGNFEVEIIDTYDDVNDNINEQGTNWLQVFRMDKFNESDQPQPDEKVDIPNIVILARGELFIPYLEPFRSAQEAASAGVDTFAGQYNPKLDPTRSQQAMYEGSYSQTSEITQESQFKIVATYSNQSSNINLPGFNIIEGSEEVILNGSRLQKGTDYTIDYFLGQVNVLNENALKPGADLEILYETNEVFQLDKKVVVGGRAEYDFGENSFLAATGMYYGKSSVDDKVRVGQEPFENFVWDVNGRFQRNLNFLTQAVDRLPMIRTDAASQFQMEGEVASVLPNPNTQSSEVDDGGVAYIDDFEGSKKTTTLTIFRRNWTKSSPPPGYKRKDRGFLYWYNPRRQVYTKSIWPEKETSVRSQNNTTDILQVTLDPRRVVGDQDPRQPGVADSVWGGIMRALPSSYRNQTESKYIEVWLRGSTGEVHIDLGLLSEDIDGDRGQFDTEDVPPPGGVPNDILDEGEDTGLDGVFDEEEVGVYGGDTLTADSPDALFEKYGLIPGDPAGDNFQYDTGEDPNQYRYINGNQGNEADEVGLHPDTEDINGNNFLDLTQRFFSYSFEVDTADNPYFVSATEYPEDYDEPRLRGEKTGWKLYRIPLSDYDPRLSSPDATLEDIQFARLWFTDFEYTEGNEDTLSIAKIEIVGNEWLEQQVRDVKNDTAITDSSFAVTVINNEENPEYKSPEGVTGAEDRVNQITTKEQSLVLNMRNMQPWREGRATRVLHQSMEMSFVNYKFLKMFIHGDRLQPPTEHVELFFRLGRDDENYYEYRTRVEEGWQEMAINLDFLSRIKTIDSLTVEEGALYPFTEPRGHVYFEDNSIVFRDTTSERKEEFVAHGNPSLGKILRMEVGVRNFSSQNRRALRDSGYVSDNWVPYNGEIWLNELRVTGVRREGGMAMRVRASLDLADLATVSVNANRQDADFHRVDTQWGSNANTEGYNLNVNLSAAKLFPESWGLRIPVRGRFSQNRRVPKYLPGSDILTESLSEDLPAAAVNDTIRKIESFSVNRSYGFSFSRPSQNDHWLLEYTLNAVEFGYDYAETRARNQTKDKDNSYTSNINAGYSVQFPQPNGIPLFSWLQGVPVLGSWLGESRLNYIPTNLNVQATLNESQSAISNRVVDTVKTSYNQQLKRNFGTGYRPFNSMNFGFNKSITSDARDYRGARRWEMIQFLKPGAITQVNENYNFKWDLQFTRWLRPSVNYQSSYIYSNNLNQAGVNVRYNQRTTVNFSLDFQQIVRNLTGGSSGRPGGGRTGRPGRPGRPDQDEESEEDEKGGAQLNLKDVLNGLLDKLQPVKFSFNDSRNGNHQGLNTAPGVLYRTGLRVHPDSTRVQVVDEYAGQTNLWGIDVSKDFSIRSGLDLTRNISLTMNYAQGVSRSTQITRSTKRTNRDFLLFQFSDDSYDLSETGLLGIPFPKLSFRWGGLESFAIIPDFVRSLSLTSDFSGRYESDYQDGTQDAASYTQNTQFNLRSQLEYGISAQASFGMTKNISSTSRAAVPYINISEKQNFSISGSYQRRAGLRIPLPFFRDLNLQNNMTFNLTFDYSSSENRSSQNEAAFQTGDKSYSWELHPQIDYSFTNTVQGGIYYKFGQRFNNRTNAQGRPTKFSDFGITVNIQIRG